MNKFYITLTIVALLFAGSILYMKEGSLPVNSSNHTPVQFEIKKGDSVTNIIDQLSKKDLIRNRIVFLFTVKRLGLDGKLQAGEYRLSQSMTAPEIAQALTRGITDVWITIVEGLRKEEVAYTLSKDLGIPESEFLTGAREGYLFPDTYLIPQDATADGVLQILYDNFAKKYNTDIQAKAAKRGLTRDEVVTLASIVEKEAKVPEDRQVVASILLKRLKNDWPLQVDATVQYALGYQPQDKTWWKKNLTIKDLKIDSPYNTYTNSGLPPGPICNPGLSSIEAVVNANTSTPYWFYISNKDGSEMHFSKTDEEHQRNIQKYLR